MEMKSKRILPKVVLEIEAAKPISSLLPLVHDDAQSPVRGIMAEVPTSTSTRPGTYLLTEAVHAYRVASRSRLGGQLPWPLV